ncbi:MAG: GFA family protein [Paracoccaceae bacterium]
MTHAELPLKGRCLCGSVQIELTSMPLLTLACHCKGCQKCSASALFPDRHVPDA